MWTPRVVTSNVDGLSTFDSIATGGGSYTGTSTWLSSCNVQNFCALVGLHGVGDQGPAYVQWAGSASPSVGTATTFTCTFTGTVNSQNQVIVDVALNPLALAGLGDVFNVTDNQGNTYTQLQVVTLGGSGKRVLQFLCPQIQQNGTLAVTITSTNTSLTNGWTDIAMAVHEYGGISSVSPVVAGNSGAHSNLLSTGVTFVSTGGILHFAVADLPVCQPVTVSGGGEKAVPIWKAPGASAFFNVPVSTSVSRGPRPILIPQMDSFNDVRQVVANSFNQLQTQIATQGPPTNFQGQRVQNIANPQQPNDAVTLGYLNSVLIPLLQNTSRLYTQQGGGSGTQTFQSLTTTNTSGAATLVSGVLNIPEYSSGSTSGLVQIAQIVVTTATGTLDFSSIPATYADLKLSVNARSSTAASFDVVLMNFNGDVTSGHYAGKYADGIGTAITVASPTTSANAYIGNISGANQVANASGVLLVDIPGYSGTTFSKFGTSHGSDLVLSNTFSSSNMEVINLAFGWNSTAAINQITLKLSSGANFTVGTIITLYGVGSSV